LPCLFTRLKELCGVAVCYYVLLVNANTVKEKRDEEEEEDE
jgi:hypothetical protein